METRKTIVKLGIWATVLVPAVSWAHPGDGSGGSFVHGLMHPVGGIDHVLAMIAVGLVAARIGGRAAAFLSASFVAVMVAGLVIGTSWLSPLQIEVGIGVSLIVAGMLVAGQSIVPVAGIMALVGGVALLHGVAHAPTFSGSGAPGAYIAGFIMTTTVAQGAFAGIGVGAMRLRGRFGIYSTRMTGSTIGLVGVGIVAQMM